MSKRVLEAIVVVAELTGTTFSKEAIATMGKMLSRLPEQIVLKALEKCMRECKQRLTLADILDRVDQQMGWIGADEAWSIANQAMDEYATVVMNQFISEAWLTARDAMPDKVAARMAFKSVYDRLIDCAKMTGEKPSWFPSLGQDPARRESALRIAADQGRLPNSQVQKLLPSPSVETQVIFLPENPSPNEKSMTESPRFP